MCYSLREDTSPDCMAHALKDLLSSAVRRQGLTRDLATLRAIDAVNSYLDTRLPGARRADAKAISVQAGTVHIACTHASVAQMLSREAAHIVYAAHVAASEAGVRRLQTKILETIPEEGG